MPPHRSMAGTSRTRSSVIRSPRGEANNRWIDASLELGQKAVACAIEQAQVQTADIGAFFFVSITGVASPSIEARLINKMGLSPRMKRIPIFGLGCVAGAAGIARAADYVKAAE